MAYTFVDLQNEVLSHQLSDTKYRNYVKVWLNEGQRYIASQVDARIFQTDVLFDTIAGTGGPYPTQTTPYLPADFARMIDVLFYSPENERIHQITQQEYDDLPSSSGRPTAYALFYGGIVLYPNPDAIYNLLIRYQKLPAELVNDGDIALLPDQYQHLMIRYTLIRCFQRENDYEAAAYWRQEFEADLQKARGELHYDFHEQPTQVEGTWGGGPAIGSNTWI